MNPLWGLLLTMLVPLHLIGIRHSWLTAAGIQLIALIVFVFVGIRWVRSGRRRVLFFAIGYPVVVFLTNVWVIVDEVFR